MQWILFMPDGVRAASLDAIGRVHEIRRELDRTVEEVRASLPRIYTGREKIYVNVGLIKVLARDTGG